MEESRDVLAGTANGVGVVAEAAEPGRLACLRALERKVLWLSTWMIHNANHLRPAATASRWAVTRRRAPPWSRS